MIQQSENGLTVEMAPRRLSQMTAVLFLMGGLLSAVASTVVFVKTHSGISTIVFSLLAMGLGALVLSNTQGVYVVFDRTADKVRGQLRPMVGSKSEFEQPLSKAKEVQLVGTVNYASVYLDFEAGGGEDSVLCGQFVRNAEQKQQLRALLKAIQTLVPNAKFVPRNDLEKWWLRD